MTPTAMAYPTNASSRKWVMSTWLIPYTLRTPGQSLRIFRFLIVWGVLVLLAVSPALASDAASVELKFHAPLHSSRVAEFRANLIALHTRMIDELGAKPTLQPVQVYVYAAPDHYRLALKEIGVDPAGRPAIFLFRNGKSYLFTYDQADLIGKLRHEFAHTVLHSSFTSLPLWLDEGLAEYYESPTGTGQQESYRYMMKTQPRLFWQPSPQRMAGWTTMRDMRSLEYAEAWSWVNLLMHSNAGQRHIRAWLNHEPTSNWTATLNQTTPAWEATYR